MGHLPPHLAQVVAQLREGLKKLYGDRFRDLLLYGSYARGDFREDSDIDLLLLLDGPVNVSEEIVRAKDVSWPLSLENTIVLSIMPASYQAYQRGESLFLRVIGGRPGRMSKEEKEAFLAKAARSLETAELLLQEGHADFAASSIYYGGLYIAQVLLASLGLEYGNHDQVSTQYRLHFAKTCRLDPSFHTLLEETYLLRQKADHATATIEADAVQDLIRREQGFLRAATDYLGVTA